MKNQQEVERLNPLYLELKDKIVDGSITQQEVAELYKSFEEESLKQMNLCLSDLDKSINPKNLHKFVSVLLEVEKDVVEERHKLKVEGLEIDEKAVKVRRCADYLRTTSLAKAAFSFECKETGFGKDIAAALQSGDKEKAVDALVDLKIPDDIKEHYITIIEPFYATNGSSVDATVNLIFHGLTTPFANTYPELFSEYNKLKDVVYEKPTNNRNYLDSYAAVYGQITAKEIPPEEVVKLQDNAKARLVIAEKERGAQSPQPVGLHEQPSLWDKIKSFVQKFTDKVSQMFSRDKKINEPAHVPSIKVLSPVAVDAKQVQKEQAGILASKALDIKNDITSQTAAQKELSTELRDTLSAKASKARSGVQQR